MGYFVPTLCVRGLASDMAVSLHREVSNMVPPAVSGPALAASPPALGQGRVVLVLLLLQGVRHNCGTLQQFWVVFLVLCLQTPTTKLMLWSRIPAHFPTQAWQEPGTRAERGWQCVS